MYGIGHVLSKIVFHETPKSFMAQSFRADYVIKLDTTFKLYETKFHRVVWALTFTFLRRCVRDEYMRLIRFDVSTELIASNHKQVTAR